MVQWEYKVVALSEKVGGSPGYEIHVPWRRAEEVEQRLNGLGREGWELVSTVLHDTSSATLFLKRLVTR